MLQTHKYPFLADLLSTLEWEGFPMGVGKHLQVQQLVRVIPEDLPVEAWKSHLSPLFVRSEAEQQHFGEIFDQVYERWKKLEQPAGGVQPQHPANLWQRMLYGILGLLLTLWGYLLYQSLFPKNPCPELQKTVSISGNAGDTLRECMGDLLNMADTITYAALSKGGEMYVDSAQQIYATLDTSGCLEVLVPYDRTSISLWVKIARGNCLDSTSLIVDVINPRTPNIDSLIRQQPPLLSTLPIPFYTDITTLKISPEIQNLQVFYDKHLWWIKLLGIGLISLGLFAFLRRKYQLRRQVIAELEQRDQPPFIWNIPFTTVPDLILDERFPMLLTQLRQRGVGENQRVDMPRTIAATAREAGRLSLRYRALRHTSDYLLLIDRQTRRNHRAQLYDYLYHTFNAQEVHIERFYYNGDPRLCWNEAYPQGISLQQLAQRYGNHRLIVISAGAAFFNPVTGRPARWSRILDSWSRRLLLSPKPWSEWGGKERRLADRFQVMPASLDSLYLAVSQWNAGESLPGDWQRQIKDAIEESIKLKGDLLSTLREYYDESMIRWIAACAIYPALQWELTLYLGQQIDDQLLRLENLRQLCRLPWFVEGKMPEAVRSELLAYLPESEEVTLRKQLYQVFSQSAPPPLDSAAYEEYTLNLIVNELHWVKDSRRRKELQEQLANHLAAGAEADWVSLKALEKPRKETDFQLPPNLNKLAGQEADRPGLLRHAFLSVLLFALLGSILMPWRPEVKACQGELITFDGMQLCLDSPEDTLVYYEYAIRKALTENNLITANNLLDETLEFIEVDSILAFDRSDSLRAKHYFNIAVSYFNGGIRRIQEAGGNTITGNQRNSPAQSAPSKEPETIFYDVMNQSQRDTVCNEYFTTAVYNIPAGYADHELVAQMQEVLRSYCVSDSLETIEPPQPEVGGQQPVPLDTLDTTGRTPIQGRVLDIYGNPVPGASVLISRYGTRTLTDGTFMTLLPVDSVQLGDSVRISITADGFASYNSRVILSVNRANRVELDDIQIQPRPEDELSTQPIVPEMIFVKGGSFLMGSPEDEPDRRKDETLHRVILSDYYIGKYEVTNAEYVRFLNAKGNQEEGGTTWIDLEGFGINSRIQFEGESYSVEKGYANYPVINVSWYGARAYCDWLNETQCGGRTGWQLPTEAQWEYAAAGGMEGYDPKGGRTFIYAGTSDLEELENYAWYDENSNEENQVGQKLPNPLGIYDMSGNVYEWCSDWYGEAYYANSPEQNPEGPKTGDLRVVRGGSWVNTVNYCRVSDRDRLNPIFRSYNQGFRVCGYSGASD